MAPVYSRHSRPLVADSDAHAELEHLRIAIDLMPMGVSYADLRTGRILYCNQRLMEIVGGDPGSTTVAEWIERSAISHADIGPLKQIWSPDHAGSLTAPVEVAPADVTLRCLDGSVKPVSIAGIKIPAAGYMLATFIDLSERVATQRALATSQLRLFSALSASRRGLYEVDLRTHTLTMVAELNSIPNLLANTSSIPLRRFWTRLHPVSVRVRGVISGVD